MARGFAAVHETLLKSVGVRKNGVSFFVVGHEFLYAEVGHPGVKVQGGAHADRRQVGGAVAAGAHLVHGGKVGNTAQVRDAAGVHDGGADVVNELVLNQVFAVPQAVENLTHGQRRGGVLADQAESLLVFSRRSVFNPEQVVGLEGLAQPRRFNRCEAVVHVVQQVRVGADSLAHGFKQLGCVQQVFFTAPVVLAGQVAVGRFVKARALGHAIDLVEAGHAALRAYGQVAHFFVAQHFFYRVRDVAAVGVAVDHDAAAAASAQQLVQRHVGGLGLDVPQRCIDRRNGAHGHRAAAPVSAFVQVLPDVFDLVRVAPDQAGDHMVLKVAHHRQLAPVQGGVADAGEAFIGFDFQGDEVAAGAADDDFGAGDFHVERSVSKKDDGSTKG